MFTLGIPLKQKRRTLGYLSNEYFPGGMKKLGQQVPYEILSSDEGFFELGFPNMDEDEFRSITFQLKQQGVTVIGADSQLTEKTMKLVNLVPLKENRLSPPKGFTGKLVKQLVDANKDTMFFANGKYYIADETAEQDYIDSLFVIDRDANPEELNFREIEFAEGDAIKMQFMPFFEEEVDEGSCGYAPEGEDPNEAEQPAGPHLLRKKIREMIESYVNDPNVPGTSGMEDAVNDPNAKAEKILMQLAKVFPDVPLSKIVNDNSYKRQAVTQILFGMMN
tara:strand:+ start:768 stop:1601 length:834 start_codon:yes stop_codon:yes gene_type:complete